MSSFDPRRPRPPRRIAGWRRSPRASTRIRNSVPIPASAPPVTAATGADSGICSGRASTTLASGTEASTGRLRLSAEGSSIGSRMLLPGSEVLLVDPVLLDDRAAHPLHRSVHRVVGLEDPAHLAAGLARRLGH